MNGLRIVSHSAEPFRDRVEAGRLLGAELDSLRGQGAVVLGIPRGGLVVAQALAAAIGGQLDIVLARKLRTPGHPELALGSVSEDGRLFLNDRLVELMGIDRSYIEAEKAAQMAEMNRRCALVRRIAPKIPLAGKRVIVTDDGVATGATLQAALWAARQEKPLLLVAALPVGPEDTIERLAADADEMLCLRAPADFAAVGQFYLRFDQVEDDTVLAILRQARRGQS